MPITTQNDSSVILGALNDAMRRHLEAEYTAFKDEAVAKLIERMDKGKDEIIAGILLHLMKRVDFQSLTDRVIVTVHTQAIQTKP